MKNLPDKIYLQIGEDINIDSSIDFNCLSEVTWCKDKINDNDTVYIRADQQQLSEKTRKDFVVLYCPECGSQELILGERINRCSNCKHVWNRAI